MFSSRKLKPVDSYRNSHRTKATVVLSIVLAMMFLFGKELNDYTSDVDFLRIDFNVSFPALSCEFASVDVSDVLGTNRLNITKTIFRKNSIGPHVRPPGVEGALPLNDVTFDKVSHMYPILFVSFYAPWCYWSTRLKPHWDKAAKIIEERYDPSIGRILLAKVDCTEVLYLCKRHRIQGYPSLRIFRNGSDVREICGDLESYYGEHDVESLVKFAEGLVASIPPENQTLALEDKSNAPLIAGCRIEGYARVKKVPGNLVISAGSGSHSFYASSQMNMSHIIDHLSFETQTISPRVLTATPLQMPLSLSLHFDRKKRNLIIKL